MFYINKLLLIIGLASVLIFIIVAHLLFEITNPKVNVLESSYDAIVILSGNPERAVVGSKLFFDLDARFIYLSKEASIIKNYIDPSIKKMIYEGYIDILIQNNIPKDNIILFGDDNKSTYDEVRSLNKSNFMDMKNILIVTDKFHIYRTKKIFSEFQLPMKTDFFYIENKTNWSKDKNSLTMVFSEIIKCFLYYIFHDFDSYLSYQS